MINRLRKGWRVSSRILATACVWCAAVCDKDDVFTVLGLALVAGGLWMVSRPLALIVPGAVLLWVFLPSRPPFIDTPTPSSRVARRPPS